MIIEKLIKSFPYNLPREKKTTYFVKGMKELTNFHKKKCKEYAKILNLFNDLKYEDHFKFIYLVMEVDKIPPKEILEKISNDCKAKTENIILILTPTQSISGVIQVVSRVSEVGLHKLHTLKFPLENVKEVSGSAPIPPVSNDFITSMGRTNDAILYGGNVELKVTGSDEEINKLTEFQEKFFKSKIIRKNG